MIYELLGIKYEETEDKHVYLVIVDSEEEDAISILGISARDADECIEEASRKGTVLRVEPIVSVFQNLELSLLLNGDVRRLGDVRPN